MSKGSDLLVAALENEGVERIFGIPGEENLDVVESLRHSSIELVITRHEQAAVFMAATYGRLTGKPGVCLATLGPGALNFTTGAAYALLGAQRNLRILGIFTRLAQRDGKTRYLAFMPRVWDALQRDLAHPALAPLARAMQGIPAPSARVLERIAG